MAGEQIPGAVTFDAPATPVQTSVPGAVTFDAPATPVTAPSDQATAASPSLGDRARDLAEKFVSSMPVVGDAHELAGVVQDWASRKSAEYQQHRLADVAHGAPQPGIVSRYLSPDAGVRVVGDVAGLVHGATSPEGLATAAGMVAAPEVVAPVMAVQGIRNMVQGWGDLRNPDVLQNELNSAAQVAGSVAAGAPEVLRRGASGYEKIKAKIKNRGLTTPTAAVPDPALSSFKTAMPPTRSAPYEDADFHAAKPYLEAEHAHAPIEGVEGVRDAADESITKIEHHIDDLINKHPDELIQTSPLNAIDKSLRNSVNMNDLRDGLSSLEGFRLGYQRADGSVDPPLTLRAADDIRLRLNQENKAILKKNNNYDQYTARMTDPAFAAREAAAEALRDGIYDKLQQLGHGDIRRLRLDEGSLIKVRNAAELYKFKGEKEVASTAKKGVVRQGVKQGIKAAGTMAGAGIGSAFGPVGTATGATMGAAAAAPVAEAITKASPLTRDQLAANTFKDVGRTQVVPPATQRDLNISQVMRGGLPAVAAEQDRVDK